MGNHVVSEGGDESINIFVPQDLCSLFFVFWLFWFNSGYTASEILLSVYPYPIHVSHPCSKVSSLKLFLISSAQNVLCFSLTHFWGMVHSVFECCLHCLRFIIVYYLLDCQLLTIDWKLVVIQQMMNKWVKWEISCVRIISLNPSYTQLSTTEMEKSQWTLDIVMRSFVFSASSLGDSSWD